MSLTDAPYWCALPVWSAGQVALITNQRLPRIGGPRSALADLYLGLSLQSRLSAICV